MLKKVDSKLNWQKNMRRLFSGCTVMKLLKLMSLNFYVSFMAASAFVCDKLYNKVVCWYTIGISYVVEVVHGEYACNRSTLVWHSLHWIRSLELRYLTSIYVHVRNEAVRNEAEKHSSIYTLTHFIYALWHNSWPDGMFFTELCGN